MMALTYLHMWAVVMVIVVMVNPTAGLVPECGGNFYADIGGYGNYSGEFNSPGYPYYPNNMRCGYHLSTEQGGTITLHFSDFDLESHNTCDYDFVQIYDGSPPTGSLIIEDKLCGSEIPPDISSNLDSMYVLFVSDSYIQHKGFHAWWTAQAPVTTTILPPTIRLVGETPYSGAVLLTSGGKTGYICDRNFTKQEADVVCRMLGYRESYKRHSNSTNYTDPTTPLLMGDLNCNDHELNIFQCPWSNDTTDCSHDDVAGVECLERPTISLVGGAANNSGTVVMTTNGNAGPVCSPWWGLMEGNVVCRMLGYSGASRVSRYNHYNYNSSNPFVLDSIKCRGNESHIMDCPVDRSHDRPSAMDVTAGVECYDVDVNPIDDAGCGLFPLLGGNGETHTDFWPQMCNITDHFGNQECVGTLVKNRQGHFFLVTLASCVDPSKPNLYRAICGMINTNGDSDLQVLEFKHITQHPELRYGNGDNDIAVVSLLFQPVENNYVQAACIANEDHAAGEVGTVVSWSYEHTDELIVRLQSNLTILPDEQCNMDDFNKYSNVCTDTVDDETCGGAGSQGGPMFTNRAGKWTLTGIGQRTNTRYSSERNCAIYKQVITDVYDMRGWLDQQINGCY